jgi:hypothetical protein
MQIGCNCKLCKLCNLPQFTGLSNSLSCWGLNSIPIYSMVPAALNYSTILQPVSSSDKLGANHRSRRALQEEAAHLQQH